MSKTPDPGGRDVTAAKHSDPQHAESFTLEPDGAFVYQHDGDDSTEDSFSFVVNDRIDGSEPTEVTLHIHQYPTVEDQRTRRARSGASRSKHRACSKGPKTSMAISSPPDSPTHGQPTLDEDRSFTMNQQ